MNSSKDIVTEEIRFIQIQKVVLTKELSKKFNCSKKSIYRRLKDKNYLRSYNNKGAYITLSEIPNFDENGLWKYKNAFFSKWHTLKETIGQLVERSEAGLTAGELIQLLDIDIYHQLTFCAKAGLISCDKTLPRPVYYSADLQKGMNQEIQRKNITLMDSLKMLRLSKDTIIKILVVLAKYHTQDIEQIIQLVHDEGVTVNEQQVTWVLEKYDIKKKDSHLSFFP